MTSSPPSPAPAGDASPAPSPLSLLERRVLGVLIEKAKTTPDAYPMSLNALITGCNQKSNRDPILDLDELTVEDTLVALQKKGLTARITGGRVERWKHMIYESWRVSKVEIAIMGELLLRGAQTEGELRGRASRMEPIDDLDVLRDVLKPLVERKYVVYLTPDRSRGAMLTHGFHTPAELAHLQATHKAEAVPIPAAAPARTWTEPTAPAAKPAATASPLPPPAPTVPPAALTALEARVSALEKENAALKQTVGELAAMKQTVADVQAQMQKLLAALGPV